MGDSRANPTTADRLEAMGDAMRYLRGRAGPNGKKLAAQAAADRIQTTRQTWDNWEAGARVILREDVQLKIAEALGVSPEQLRYEYEKRLGLNPPPPVIDSKGTSDVARPFEAFPQLPRLLMPDDHLRPWAASGTIIVYEPGRWPREGDGCVIETDEGKQVKIFVRADAEAFHVRELSPAREIEIPRATSQAHAVIARIG